MVEVSTTWVDEVDSAGLDELTGAAAEDEAGLEPVAGEELLDWPAGEEALADGEAGLEEIGADEPLALAGLLSPAPPEPGAEADGLEVAADEALPLAGLLWPAPPGPEAEAEADGLEVSLATLLEEVPMVTVEDQLRVMVEKIVEVLPAGPLPELVEAAPATELLVGGRTPGRFEMVVVGVMPDVVTDVSVSGQTVVETGMTEVTMEAEPLTGQLLTLAGQLRMVTSLVE